MLCFRDYLVFDRTQYDVDRAKYLISLFDEYGAWTGTAAEREELDQNHGIYTPLDLNRVIRAYCYVATRLYELGYTVDTPFYPAYLICATVSPHGTGSAAGDGIFFKGESVTLTATPAAGFEFVLWRDDTGVASYQKTYRFTADRSRTLTAIYNTDGGKELGIVGYGTIGRARIGLKEM